MAGDARDNSPGLSTSHAALTLATYGTQYRELANQIRLLEWLLCEEAWQNRVIVKVWHGLVTEVYADDKAAEVVVIDGDNGELLPEGPELPPHLVYEI